MSSASKTLVALAACMALLGTATAQTAPTPEAVGNLREGLERCLITPDLAAE